MSGQVDGADSPRLTLEPRPSLRPNWAEPRIVETALYDTVESVAGTARIRGEVALQPGRTAVIGPRGIALDAARAASLLPSTRLRVNGRPIDLSSFPVLAPRSARLGPRQARDLGIDSGQVAQYGVVATDLGPGEHTIELTEVVDAGSSVRTVQTEIALTVRPYLSGRFAAAAVPALPREGGRWMVPEDTLVVSGGDLFDGTGRPVLEDAVVVIRDRHILAVGGSGDFAIPDGATRIDATDKTLLPGFIDAHLHYLPDYGRPVEDWLRAGVTTLVDLGGSPEALFTARERFSRSARPMPALFVAGAILGRLEHPIRRNWGEGGFYAVEDEDAAREAAAAVVRAGADVAKIALGGDGRETLSAAQICAVVETVHRGGLPVVAHVGSTEDIRRAAACGVDVVTHLPPLDAATVDLIASTGMGVVPTLNIYGGDRLERALRDVAALHHRGVPIGVGDDFPAGRRASPLRELHRLERAGLSPAQAIQAGTRVNAEILGIADAVGTVTPGKLADLVAIDGDPLGRLDRIRSVAFVIARGRVVR